MLLDALLEKNPSCKQPGRQKNGAQVQVGNQDAVFNHLTAWCDQAGVSGCRLIALPTGGPMGLEVLSFDRFQSDLAKKSVNFRECFR